MLYGDDILPWHCDNMTWYPTKSQYQLTAGRPATVCNAHLNYGKGATTTILGLGVTLVFIIQQVMCCQLPMEFTAHEPDVTSRSAQNVSWTSRRSVLIVTIPGIACWSFDIPRIGELLNVVSILHYHSLGIIYMYFLYQIIILTFQWKKLINLSAW